KKNTIEIRVMGINFFIACKFILFCLLFDGFSAYSILYIGVNVYFFRSLSKLALPPSMTHNIYIINTHNSQIYSF
ncbi:MAG TPA: hypothetical protein PLD87_05920, partial [Bacteroidia bacterium]|nr:hypothetical protein [Bacteroidia bacterium]